MPTVRDRTSVFQTPRTFLQLEKTEQDILRSLPTTRSAENFRELEVEDNGNGSFAAYGNVKGYLDTHGTIMWHGCYVKSAPKLLVNGFVPDTHGAASFYTPTHAELIAFFSDVWEDDYGLALFAEFHSTTFAQQVRTQIQERMAAGKTCGMSIGFQIKESITILAKDFATEIPKYSLPQFVEQNLQRAQGMWCVDVCTEIDVFEVSLTVIPSNEASVVLEVRSDSGPRTRAQVTPAGILHWRSKEFESFSTNAIALFTQMNGLDTADRIAFLADLPPQHLSTLTELITMATEQRGRTSNADKRGKDLRSALDSLSDAHEALQRHDKRAKELHDDLSDHHEKRSKLMKEATRAMDKLSDLCKDDDDAKTEEPKDDPKKDEPKEDKRTGVFEKLRQQAVTKEAK